MGVKEKEGSYDDVSEYWHDVTAARKEKRAQNRASSPVILKTRGIAFEEKNYGAHLIVTHNGQVVDFWPGTGKYIFRMHNIRGYGVFNLIKALNQEERK